MQKHLPPRGASIRCITRTYATGKSTAAKIFADPKHAEFLAAAGSVASLPVIENNPPEIVVTGRANVGKSTLLNAVLGRKDLLNTSKKAGRTQTLNFYRVGTHPPKLILVDAPGYGSRGRPEWGQLFDHYVTHRQELKRIYILINGSHGLKESDRMMLETLNKQCEEAGLQNRPLSFQAVFTKCDIPTSRTGPAVKAMQREARFGIDQVRQSIVDACGLGRVAEKIQLDNRL